jgi:hypothetical protein
MLPDCRILGWPPVAKHIGFQNLHFELDLTDVHWNSQTVKLRFSTKRLPHPVRCVTSCTSAPTPGALIIIANTAHCTKKNQRTEALEPKQSLKSIVTANREGPGLKKLQMQTWFTDAIKSLIMLMLLQHTAVLIATIISHEKLESQIKVYIITNASYFFDAPAYLLLWCSWVLNYNCTQATICTFTPWPVHTESKHIQKCLQVCGVLREKTYLNSRQNRFLFA